MILVEVEEEEWVMTSHSEEEVAEEVMKITGAEAAEECLMNQWGAVEEVGVHQVRKKVEGFKSIREKEEVSNKIIMMKTED
jgi:hypothetical protein